MAITITVFARSPDGGRGLARDMAVRWALEEVGADYAVRPVDFADLRQPEHLARQPFGQIPTYEDGRVTLFESAAIVLHIAETFGGLLPVEPGARARAIGWMFAAIGTVEPPIVACEQAGLTEHDRPWQAERLPLLIAPIRQRLLALADRLGGAQWLEGAFGAADLVMIGVLRRPAAAPVIAELPILADYVARGEARPAFTRAFAAQRALFLAAEAAAPRPVVSAPPLP